jgi:hypothetical protein
LSEDLSYWFIAMFFKKKGTHLPLKRVNAWARCIPVGMVLDAVYKIKIIFHQFWEAFLKLLY